MEMIEPGIMVRRPREKEESLFSGGVGVLTVIEGAMIGVITLIAYYIGAKSEFLPNTGTALGETMCFSVLALSQLVHAMNVRSSYSLFKVGFLSNPYMVRAVIVSSLLILAVLRVPILYNAFKLMPMNAMEYGIVITLSLVPLVAEEVGKAVVSLKKLKAS
jgi:Ca2+-transporting ATPase